jgi:hypothetical protein
MSDEQPESPFPPEVKEALFDYITADGYTNRERVPPAKIIRYSAFLDNPDLKPKDQIDSKIKFEARNFYELIDNTLHRQHDKTHPIPRCVVPQNKAFDIIVSKHIQLGILAGTCYFMPYALRSKHAEPIAECVAQFIMAFFPIRILQCNNGK